MEKNGPSSTNSRSLPFIVASDIRSEVCKRSRWLIKTWKAEQLEIQGAGVFKRDPLTEMRGDPVPNLSLWAHFEWQHSACRLSHNYPVQSIDLSLFFFLTDSELLSEKLYWMEVLLRGVSDQKVWIYWIQGSGFDMAQCELISDTPIRNPGKLLPSCVYSSLMLGIPQLVFVSPVNYRWQET